MTKIDFHFGVGNKLLYACQLVRKIYSSAQTVVVFSNQTEQLAEFDNLLWVFSDQAFIPHVPAENPLANETPVWLASGPVTPQRREVLVNLGLMLPPMLEAYGRLVEIVSTKETDKHHARLRWRHYQLDASHQLQVLGDAKRL